MGTWINNERIQPGSFLANLKDGDLIKFGQSRSEFK